jgi:hypothetical protein
MRLLRQIRALVTMIALASHTPIGHVDQLGLSLFVGRFTRVAAAQQFDPTRPTVALSLQQRPISVTAERPDGSPPCAIFSTRPLVLSFQQLTSAI